MQKKILLVMLICFIVNAANAQIRKGATLLGGQPAFFTQYSKNSQTNSTESKSNSFTFSPAFG